MTRLELVALAEDALKPLFRQPGERCFAAQSVVDIVLLAPYDLEPGADVRYQARPGARWRPAKVQSGEVDGAIWVYCNGSRLAQPSQIQTLQVGRGGVSRWRSLA